MVSILSICRQNKSRVHWIGPMSSRSLFPTRLCSTRWAQKNERYIIEVKFSNAANILSHYETTGPEIWRQTEGAVDIVCFGVGSGGTISGVGQYLREMKPGVKAYAAEPFESSVISGEKAAPHLIAGIGAGNEFTKLDYQLMSPYRHHS